MKPDRIQVDGVMVDDYWKASLRILGDMKFLEGLLNFDKDNIPEKIMAKIRTTILTNPNFDPDKIRNASTACEGLCKWVISLSEYDTVAKVVAPKKIALAKAEAEYAEAMTALEIKRGKLREVQKKVQALEELLAQRKADYQAMTDEVDDCEQKLRRAEELIGGLGGEYNRSVLRICGQKNNQRFSDIFIT